MKEKIRKREIAMRLKREKEEKERRAKQAAEIIQRPGEHPRLKRDSGSWAGRKPQQGGLPQQGNLRMGGI